MTTTRGVIKYETYRRSAAVTKDRFLRIKKSVDKLAALDGPLSPVQLKSLANYSSELEKKKIDFELSLERVLEHVDESEAPATTLADDQDEISELFVEISSLIATLTPEDAPKTPSTESTTGSAHFPINSAVRLPKLELKSFDGSPLHWVAFINLFDTSIHHNSAVTNVVKFQYLLSVLSGEPLALVKSLSLTNANYIVAYNLLRERYHNTRRLVTLHLNQILDLPTISSSSVKQMRNFVNVFYEHTEALKALSCDISSSPNPLLSALLLRKLDQDLRKKLEQHRTSQGTVDDPVAPHSLPVVTDIVKFLNTECTHVEDASLHNVALHSRPSLHNAGHDQSPNHKKIFSKTTPHTTPKNVSMISTSGPPKPSRGSSNPFTCFACNKSGHKIYVCPVFKDANPRERHHLVKLHNRCFSCLGNHSVKDCQSKASCHTCGQRHHTLLHFNSQSGFSDSSPSPQGPPAQVSLPPQSNGVALIAQTQPGNAPCSTVLLGTTLIKLTTPTGHSHVFRALLDSGSMSDFITERAAQLLGSPRQRSNLTVVGLSHTQTQTRGKLPLSLETLGGHVVTSQHPFHVLEKISVDLPRTAISPEVYRLVKECTLADPTFHLPRGIDVLLGGSLFPKILTQQNYPLGPNLPNILGTLFGHVLMGTAPCDLPSPSTANLTATMLSSTDVNLHTSQQHFWQQEEPPYRLKTFVANRVAQAQEDDPPQCWKYVKSADNPADCASRGILPSILPEHSLWWTGPSWLKSPPCEWPDDHVNQFNESSMDEVKTTPLVVLHSASQESWPLLCKFSSWTRLRNVFAYVIRFVHNVRSHSKFTGPLSTAELQSADTGIFKTIQGECFEDIVSLLRQGKPLHLTFRRLCPFLDDQGLLRVGGRLRASSLPHDVQHPVILPKKHHAVDLLIDYYHKKHLHAGAQLTQALITQKVWIMSARSVIRSRIYRCLTCFRHRPQNQTPLMGDLPSPRVTPSRPFLKAGMDYGGPFPIKIYNLRGIRHVKAYLCLFVCLATKAVHLEVVTDLTTDSFLAALTRFVSRRGLCSDLYSDCGTNFVGAKNSLRKLIESSGQPSIQNFAAQHGLRFHFNPPAAPHQGGLWESAIKSAKHHLLRVIGTHVLTLAELMTLTTQVEAILNSRPLTPLSNDPHDLSVLTPGHFLIGAPLVALPEPNVAALPDNRLKHWQLVQALHQRIWKRWHLEYLHHLQQRLKWDQASSNLRVGDMVLIHQATPPLTWPLARIVAVSPGADGVVRVVHLQTPQGPITRPAVKVFPLPTCAD